MRNSFDLLNDIFDWCVADEEIMRMLSVTDNTNTDVLKNKLRLECQADEAVTAAEVPFIAYYFTRAEKLEYNWLVNKGELYVDIYTDTLLNACPNVFGSFCQGMTRSCSVQKVSRVLVLTVFANID